MRKIFIGLILTITIVAIFSGCGKQNNFQGQPPSDSSVVEQNESPETVGTADVGYNEYNEIYSGVISRYYQLITGYSEEWEILDGEIGVLERITMLDTNDALETIGYTIQDISGDEVPELIIAAVSDSTDGIHHGTDILAVHTIVDGTPKLSFEGWIRNNYLLLENNTLLNRGSGGAMYSIFGTYTLSKDGTSLTNNEYYFTCEKGETFDEIGIYYNTSGEWDKDISEELDISIDEFWEIYRGLAEGSVRSLELIPFSSMSENS